MRVLSVAVCLTILAVCTCSPSWAEIKTIGTGANMGVDISGFPPNIQAIYPLFNKKCIKCHGMDRTYVTIQSGLTPSGVPFDDAAVDAYGAKMLRKPDSDMSKPEVKQFVEFMKFLLVEAAK